MDVSMTTVIINIATQLAMIGLIFWLAYRFGWKKFQEYIIKRQAISMQAISDAEEQSERAHALEVEAETRMKEINEEAKEILKRAEETAEKLSQERHIKLNEELSRKRKNANMQLEQEKVRQEQEMEKEVIERATEVAAQFLSSKATPESTEEQIESFLRKMGDE